MAELTKEQIEEAKKQKHCPFCQGNDFRATYDLTGRNFWIENGKIEFDEREKGKIFCVQCNACLEEIPEEVWSEWGIEQIK